MLIFVATTIICLIGAVTGHGYLIEPPSRSSAWRYGFKTPPNYNDQSLFCGGFSNQWNENAGKCGVCGDPYQGPHDNEAGGRYATGTIVRQYKTGQLIDVAVELTAAHKGYFEFRLCANNNPSKRVTQQCLDTNHLLVYEGRTASKRLPVNRGQGKYRAKLKLPSGLTCSQCVLQWRYRTGNSWGQDVQTGRSCLGCGKQEEFYNCADVAVHNNGGLIKPTTKSKPIIYTRTQRPAVTVTVTTPAPSRSPQRTAASKTTHKPTTIIKKPITYPIRPAPPRRTKRPSTHRGCKATGPWMGNTRVDAWCVRMCAISRPACPPSHCKC